MTPNTVSLTRNGQRANCRPETREKARRLVVETINEQAAYVVGDSDLHLVTFHDLQCDCQASTCGLRCSHVLSALRELAILHGFSHTAFLRSQDHAESYGAMQRGLGRNAVSHTHGRYFYVTFSTTDVVDLPTDSAVLETGSTTTSPMLAPRPVRPMADVQAAADSLFL